jgi:hypothetical protein
MLLPQQAGEIAKTALHAELHGWRHLMGIGSVI